MITTSVNQRQKEALEYLEFLLGRAEEEFEQEVSHIEENSYFLSLDVEKCPMLLSSCKLNDLIFDQTELQIDDVFMRIEQEANGFDFESMRDWELNCLQKHLLQQRNLLMISGTASGKTYVSIAFALYTLITLKESVIFAAPFITIVNELVEEFSEILNSKYGLCGLSGLTPLPEFLACKPTIYVCTLEKAFILAKEIQEERIWDRFGLLIVDELQIVGESNERACNLELMINYFLLHESSSSTYIKILAMSATISNVEEVAEWLDAELYETTFSTQKIERIIVKDEAIYDFESREEISKFKFNYKINVQMEYRICIIAAKPLLVFVPTKNACVYMAEELARIYQRLQEEEEFANGNGRNVTDEALIQKRKDLLEELETRQFSVLYGIAYHNASLSGLDRENIEEAYKNGVLYIIIATSTLAAGVNLPAVTVFIFQLKIGRAPLDSVKFAQMEGRAGRFKENPNGMLIIYSDDVFVELNLISKDFNCGSELFTETNKINSMNAVLVNALTFDVAFLSAFEKTLYFAEEEQQEEFSFKNNIDFLTRIGFLLQSSGKYKITTFGVHANKVGLLPYQAHYLLELVRQIRDNGINPFDKISILLFCAQIPEEELQYLQNHSFSEFLLQEWEPFKYDKNEILVEDELLLNILEINAARLGFTTGVYILSSAVEIYTAVNAKNNENLLKEAAATLSVVTEFAELEEMPIAPLLKRELDEIKLIFEEDVTRLLEIRGVGIKRAEKLKQAGFSSQEDIISAGLDQLRLRCNFGEMNDAVCSFIWKACQDME